MEIIVIAVFIYLIINIITASYMQDVAYKKGYDSTAHVFAVTLWLGIIGCLYVLALPDMIARKNQEELIKLLNDINSTTVDELDELPEL